MATCAWLEDNGMCLIKTILDRHDFVYCEFDEDDMRVCPKYSKYNEEDDNYEKCRRKDG